MADLRTGEIGGMQQNDAVLTRLKEGIRRFQREHFADRRAQYELAATTQQRPHTLLITCADSRLDPETLTQSAPGEVFVTRNIGNMVPPYGEMLGGVSAVIEYAVDMLGVQHVVVCGHTDCGAMKAIIGGEDQLDSMPTVKRWLRNADAARRVSSTLDEGEISLKTITEQNVLLQMAHLRTHPSVAGAIALQKLTISGWIYDIFHGDVGIYDEASARFVSVRDGAQSTPA